MTRVLIKALQAVVLALGLMGGLTQCESVLSRATWHALDLRTVESLGGLELGKPQGVLHKGEPGDVLLPIRFDVSGTQTITHKPTRLESGLACAPPLVSVRGQSIRLTLRTCLATQGRTSQCPVVNLGRLREGGYVVYYVDPDGTEHPLGMVSTTNLFF